MFNDLPIVCVHREFFCSFFIVNSAQTPTPGPMTTLCAPNLTTTSMPAARNPPTKNQPIPTFLPGPLMSRKKTSPPNHKSTRRTFLLVNRRMVTTSHPDAEKHPTTKFLSCTSQTRFPQLKTSKEEICNNSS